MVPDGKYTYCGENCTTYRIVKPLCYTPETNICELYLNIKI